MSHIERFFADGLLFCQHRIHILQKICWRREYSVAISIAIPGSFGHVCGPAAPNGSATLVLFFTPLKSIADLNLERRCDTADAFSVRHAPTRLGGARVYADNSKRECDSAASSCLPEVNCRSHLH